MGVTCRQHGNHTNPKLCFVILLGPSAFINLDTAHMQEAELNRKPVHQAELLVHKTGVQKLPDGTTGNGNTGTQMDSRSPPHSSARRVSASQNHVTHLG